MTNLDSVLKTRDITLPTKVCIVKAMVFPVVTYGCESWTVKEAECQRIDAFELWCWGRLLRVPWTGRRSNQSILREINPEYSLEGLMLKLKFQYLIQTADSLEEFLILGKTEGRRSRRHQRMRRLDSITDAMNMKLCKLWEMVRDGRPSVLQSTGSRGHRVGHDWSTEQQLHSTQLTFLKKYCLCLTTNIKRRLEHKEKTIAFRDKLIKIKEILKKQLRDSMEHC